MLLREYQDYVRWCKEANTHPIGFINWKCVKFNASFNEETGVWTIKDKPIKQKP